MAWFKRHKSPKSGATSIPARDLRKIAETATWAGGIRAQAPLSILATAAGPLLRYAGPIFGAYIGVTTSAISARSGSTPGSGSFKIQTWNGSALADLAGPITETALNISSASGGIASGKYIVVLKISGAFWIITAEC